MPDTIDTALELETSLRRLEARVEELERWRREFQPGPHQPMLAAAMPTEAGVDAAILSPAPPVEDQQPIEFDLGLIGRTLIVLGGAYLLRAVTEGGMLPAAAGVLLGLIYAAGWSLHALRRSVGRASAAHHGVATAFTALPLLFEASRKFHVFGAWSSAIALAAISLVVLALAWRRRLHGVAWTFTLMALALTPFLMGLTESIVPFALYLAALGIATLWLGYLLEWTQLRWLVAFESDVVLALLSFFVVTKRLPGVTAEAAIAVSCAVFAAWLANFAMRTLVRQREAVPFEIAQTVALVCCALGGAMWVAASTGTLEVTLAVAMLALGGASYAVSFAFIPRHFDTPTNFVFYSSLALMLIVLGGAFLTRGIGGTLFWLTISVASASLAVYFRKSSLALHSAVYLVSGFVGAGVIGLGLQSLFLRVEEGWTPPGAGAVMLLFATAVAAATPPIERKGTYELWTAAKAMILAELGWILATLTIGTAGFLLLNDRPIDAAVVAVVRTAVFAGLTIATAWASRFAALAPGRLLCTPLLVVLAVKLLWEDFRVGRPSTLFVSLAIVGVALIVTPRLRRRAAAV